MIGSLKALRLAAIIASLAGPAIAQQSPPPMGQPSHAPGIPKFEPEPFWPKPLPGNWILGQVSGIAVDRNDHIWIVHRPATLLDDEKGATKNPPETKCCTAAPPVLEFDQEGTLLRYWGGLARVTIGRGMSMASMSTARATSGLPATTTP